MRIPLNEGTEPEEGDEVLGRPTYQVLNEFREWYDGYRNAHIEYEDPDGEIVRTQLENSYQPGYGDRYYARLKDLERGIRRRWDDVTTVMLTFTASHRNANGNLRCPGDHMRDVADGWSGARKMVHKALSGRKWEYARIWEPHQDGYGHLHVAIFVEGEANAAEFAPTMRSYTENVESAGTEAHSLENAVSVNDNVENLGSYISEYLGAYGESIEERPVSEQVFYATTWATNTRRLDFSNGAQDIISGEEFRRETGLRPEDRGVDRESEQEAQSAAESVGSGEWSVDSICYVNGRTPEHTDPTSGGVQTARIDGKPGADPPRSVE
jgi:hypothetical protein